jgi:hypothetical protein
MNFKRTSIIKYPIELVWATMRDKMPEVVNLLPEIASVDISAYATTESGDVLVTKVWSAAPKLPDFVAKHIQSDMLSWTEYGEWVADSKVCAWSIESHGLKDAIDCKGETGFEPALGGKGTRITFSGNVEIDAQKLSERLRIANAISTQVLELVAHSVIPHNFGESAKAIEKYLGEKK